MKKNADKKEKPESLQPQFDKYLRQQLGREYLSPATHIGIQVEYKEIFHNLKKIEYAELGEIKRFKERQVAAVKGAIYYIIIVYYIYYIKTRIFKISIYII